MKKLHQIRYPTNRADAIRYTRYLDAQWAAILSIPDRRRRGKEILRLIKETQKVQNYLDNQKEDDKGIEESASVIQAWLKRHWKGSR